MYQRERNTVAQVNGHESCDTAQTTAQSEAATLTHYIFMRPENSSRSTYSFYQTKKLFKYCENSGFREQNLHSFPVPLKSGI